MKQLTFIALLLVTLAYSETLDEYDIESDEVTVEDEPTPDVDIPYTSPTPVDPSRVYLADHFDDESKFNKLWIKSQAKKEGISEDIAKYDGLWSLEEPQKDGLLGDKGLVLKSKAKHAAISSRLMKPFTFNTKPLVVQYEVTFQNGQECGGAYLKLLTEGADSKNLAQFTDKTPYTIMFGPDKCGTDHKLHFIFRHKNPKNGSIEEKHCKKPKERLEDLFSDKLPHLFKLVLTPDNSYEVFVDNKIFNTGTLFDDFTPPVNPPAEIDDPTDQKPDDWDEREKIPDPEARKPEDWDEDAPPQIIDENAVMPDGWLEDEPTHIPDITATKPEDWDTEMDGEWEPPLIDNPKCTNAVGCGKWEPPLINNPDYKGKWKAPLIDNPNYKGKWTPRQIPNPDYFEDKHPFRMQPIGAVGFELWSMSENILFDNVIVTDSIHVAEQWASETFTKKRAKISRESESVFEKLANLTNEYPALWAVYIIVSAIPVIAILYLCCRPSSSASQEREERKREASVKKTDEVTADDDVIREHPEPEDDRAGGDNERDPEKYSGDEDDEEDEDEEESKEVPKEKEGSVEAPRKRKPRKD